MDALHNMKDRPSLWWKASPGMQGMLIESDPQLAQKRQGPAHEASVPALDATGAATVRPVSLVTRSRISAFLNMLYEIA